MATKDVLGEDVDGDAFVKATEGFTGAEIVGICQLAGNTAALRWQDKKDRLNALIQKEELEFEDVKKPEFEAINPNGRYVARNSHLLTPQLTP